MFTCQAPDCNTGSGDSGSSIMSENSFNPTPNAASTKKCNNKNT